MWCPFYILIPKAQNVTQNWMKIMEFIRLNVLPPLLAVLEITAKETSLSFIIFMCNLNMFLFSRYYIKQIVLNIVYDFSQEILKLLLNLDKVTLWILTLTMSLI